jgi:RNA polymerase sigma factor (sigma-70 family)
MADLADDGELYKRAVTGDRSAVEALVSRHHGDLVLYLRARTRVEGAAEDAVAEAWLQFFRHVKKAGEDPSRALDKPESIRFWLYRTAVNALNTYFRGQGRQAELADRATAEAETQGLTVQDDDDLATLDAIEGEERRVRLRDALSRLGEQCRELLSLMAADPPLSYAEIAELTGRPVGSLGPTRQRCLSQLRRQMGVAG